MYLVDYHTHTKLSPDGSVPLREMAQAAIHAGLAELCVTDHYDMLGIRGGREPAYDWVPAIAQFQEVAPTVADKLKLRLGVEFGSPQVDPQLAEVLTAIPEVDFVIGSLHNFSQELGGVDFFFTDYNTDQQCYHALDDYFTSMEALVTLPACYDVVGHIPYPLRYMKRPIALERHYDRLRGIFQTVAQTGRGLEINTYRGKTIAEWKPLLALFKEAGGEIVTIGSDAHSTDAVGQGCQDAALLLAEVGFGYLTVYEKRKPSFVKL